MQVPTSPAPADMQVGVAANVTSHDRARRQPQIPIALAAQPVPTSRDFVPWRFSDAGRLSAVDSVFIAGVRKPAQKASSATTATTRRRGATAAEREIYPAFGGCLKKSETKPKFSSLAGINSGFRPSLCIWHAATARWSRAAIRSLEKAMSTRGAANAALARRTGAQKPSGSGIASAAVFAAAATGAIKLYCRISWLVLFAAVSGTPAAFAQSPPILEEQFGAASAVIDGSATLVFVVFNPNPSTLLSGLGFDRHVAPRPCDLHAERPRQRLPGHGDSAGGRPGHQLFEWSSPSKRQLRHHDQRHRNDDWQ